MAPFKAKLKAAQQSYLQHKYEDALEQCNSALQDNEDSPDGLMYVAGCVCNAVLGFFLSSIVSNRTQGCCGVVRSQYDLYLLTG